MTAPLTPILSRLIETANDVRQNPPGPDELAFLARQLVQVTLPHSDPGDMRVWERRNGHITLSIVAGRKGYPYGTIPRLLLFWLTGEAVRKGKRRIELGDSMAAFMRQLGLNPASGGGKRGDAPRLREQATRLFRATVSFDYDKEADGVAHEQWLDMRVAPKGELWWDVRSPEQPSIFGSWIELGEEFYDALIAAPVPLDMRALQALKNSPLALDLYAWAAWRSFAAMKSGKPQFVSWRALMEQTGMGYSNMGDARRKIKIALAKVAGISPGLQCEQAEGGIKILPSSRPPISTIPP